jgi:hypothetical protein
MREHGVKVTEKKLEISSVLDAISTPPISLIFSLRHAKH